MARGGAAVIASIPLGQAGPRRALGLDETAAPANAAPLNAEPGVGSTPTPAAKGDATKDTVDHVNGPEGVPGIDGHRPASQYADEVADLDD